MADAHRDDGVRFIVRPDEKMIAFLELERAVCIHLLTEATENRDHRSGAGVPGVRHITRRRPDDDNLRTVPDDSRA